MFCKYCGFTRKEDVDFAVSLKVDAIGLVFYPGSKRYIDASTAAKITSRVSSSIMKVGIFVNESIDVINDVSKNAGLDYVQLFAAEKTKAARIEYPVLLSYRIENSLDFEKIDCKGPFLLDALSLKGEGGTGESFDWTLLKDFKLINKTIIAGGVNCDNLNELFQIAKPYGVDLSSGLEDSPGIKSHKKMEQFKKRLEELTK
ncbi:MAG: phosphoribosylanthranilate isomerase [Spirochaetes bacterium]|nr:phosphoribosylanthranilate isomerase [Spirochaetota bacterium]MBN2770318.1 phosphoribosylanthranilate isomerase [Spirochaetota bacterium]